MVIEIFNFPIISDDKGKLVAIESNQQIPFEVKRVYYIYDVPSNMVRGFHAHKELKQIIIALHGTCKLVLDDGLNKQIILLDKPNKGIFVNSNIWREMYDFSNDCVLMVLASDYYRESDYIRTYSEFKDYLSVKTS